MTRLIFETAAPVAPASPNRMDVACFVGFIRRRRTHAETAQPTRSETPAQRALRDHVSGWLAESGWLKGPYARKSALQLLDVPVPVESWDQFAELFDWRWRPTSSSGMAATTYLGAAVRSFFAQGGRRCYVVRAGSPWRPDLSRGVRLRKLANLLPGYPAPTIQSTPGDRGSWHGVTHVFGLPDVTLLCVPDLVDILAVAPRRPARPVRVPPLSEDFVECSTGGDEAGDQPVPEDSIATRSFAPRVDGPGSLDWARVVHRIVALLRSSAREVQLVAAVPIPVAGTRAEVALLENGLAGFLEEAGVRAQRDTWIASSFVQLAYPWVRTPGSAELPERLESPDGVLAGVLARNALLRGAYRSAAGLHLADVYDVYPKLSRRELAIRITSPNERGGRALVERVSLLGRVPSGLTLLSDVTASPRETYRPASVHRLISVIARAARQIGEAATFEESNEAMWLRVQGEMERLLAGLHQDGALRGATSEEAFDVRCDRTTMTQQDIDSGRVIVSVQVAAAAPIELIRITLALHQGGVTLLTPAIPQEAAA